ncbi:MAG TPA: PIG-L family deacetylase [Acidimicrobiia bacterium]|nr:PIG-L family deacetylase [Acidimicrobiia bacterium]
MAAVPEMREWGLVAAEELRRIVVISPHLDDAVLGCSYLMARHPGATVVTVFAGRPDAYPEPMERWDALRGFVPGDEVHVARRSEDEAALAVLDAKPVWLDFVEHSYLERDDWVSPAAVVDHLSETVGSLDPTAVFAPFGLANPDHDCTHAAAMLVRERLGPDVAWFCYEDTGYKHIPGLLAWRIARLFRAGTWPTPAAVPVAVDHERKMQAVGCYPSQLRALEADWQISAKLAAPSPEQYWRLAPPPDGWGALSER